MLQEVFVQVWTRADTYNVQLGTPIAWLVRIARNRAIDRLRANAVRIRTTEAAPLPPPVESPERRAAMSEQERAVARALEALPPDQRQLIEQAYFAGLTQSELAERFGLPLGTVKTARTDRHDDVEARSPAHRGWRAEIRAGMSIDFRRIGIPARRIGGADAEAPRPEVRERLMATIRADEPCCAGRLCLQLRGERRLGPAPRPGHPHAGPCDESHGRLRDHPARREARHPFSRALPLPPEECYVVSGSVYTYGRRMGPGDFLHADGGTDHGELWTDEGAQVLLVVPPEDYMPDPRPK